MVFACTGGGILVPIFLNKVPVPLAMDAYPIAIACSFFLHYFFPILREVLQKSPIVDASFTFLYEVTRASVVVKFTGIAREVIPASDFSFPVFGPIFCGAISGCGGAFLPLNKGLDPIKSKGLASPMFTALVGATFYHLFLSLYGEENVMQANRKAHFATVLYFVLNNYNNKWGFNAPRPKDVPVEKKKKLK
eukprot:CAMPEP_0202458422 /NCGR_PEP_ID=MMETSP1360-20130828/25060_1 /ASSEMBLY_ACC=CAM_ASM_000848 /TAXON_ID=515479 /ORGANISM="Licmophora paradoxa, Strain CCMP2313" /LENGTH=191 /DNA_ID=CAMNT_0049078955 /DNA_START=198 /DNA_END=771 /DNA_ORIENTATION=-